MNRRHVLKLIGFSALPSCRRKPELLTYSSVAFGTDIHFQAHSISKSLFEKVSEATSIRLQEIDFLFSLYNPSSAISRLNRDGYLENPSAEFLKLIETSILFGEKTRGLFDITVQPLWEFRQKWKQANLPERAELEKDPWQKAVSLVDFRKISATPARISFVRPGMGISLNAIAQGHATDEIRKLLQQAGVDNSLVNIGEYAALGTDPAGRPWPIQIRTKSKQTVPRTLPANTALAVSAGYGHTFDPSGRYHHIFRPTTGENSNPESTIVVTAPTATEADALATTLAVANAAERAAILLEFPEARFTEIK